MKTFKKYSNETIPDLSLYINEWLLKYPNSEIVLGTDSIETKGDTIYATALALFYPKDEMGMGSGAHVIFYKEKFRKRFDFWTRLWNEIEYSREIGEYIMNNTNCKNLKIHIDINSDEDYKSNKLFSAAVGYLKSFNFDVQTKPYAWVASTVADYLVR